MRSPIADGALREGWSSSEALQAMRAFQTRWPGVRKADVGLALVDGRRESWLESASVAMAHRLGFSVPDEPGVGSTTWTATPSVGSTSCGALAGVIGEADGRGKYLGRLRR